MMVGLPIGPADVGRRAEDAGGNRFPITGWDGERLSVGDDRVGAANTFHVEPPGLAAADLQLLFEQLYPPDETELFGDWVLRWTARESDGTWGSVRVSGKPGDDLRDVERWYRRRGRTPVLQIPAPSFHDAALREKGWTVDYTVEALTAPLEKIAALDERHRVTLRPISDTDRPYAPAGTVVAEAFAAGEKAGEGRARIALPVKRGTGIHLGLTSFRTAEKHRRTGVATSIVRALAEYGLRHRAGDAFLQVVVGNDAGRSMYRVLGFAHHHTYRYWTPMRR